MNLREEIKEIVMKEFVSEGFYDYEKFDSPAIDALLNLFRSFALEMADGKKVAPTPFLDMEKASIFNGGYNEAKQEIRKKIEGVIQQ